MPDIDPIIGYGLTASALIVLILQAAKKFGLPIALAPWAALALSVLFITLNAFVRVVPEIQQVLDSIIAAVSVFLLATGLYEAGKNTVSTTKELLSKDE